MTHEELVRRVVARALGHSALDPLAERVAAKANSQAAIQKLIKEAGKASAIAERTQKKLLAQLYSRRVNRDEIDHGMKDLHVQYGQAKKIAEAFVAETEKYIGERKDSTYFKNAEHDLTILKDTIKRYEASGVEKEEDFGSLYTNDDLGSGPMRKSPHHKIIDRIQMLGNAPQGFFHTMQSLQMYSLARMM